MRIRHRTLSLLLVLSLFAAAAAVPATALGQSAGDEQYVDPFQEDNSGGGNQGDSGNPAPQEQAPATEAPTTPVPTDTAGATAAQEGGNGSTSLPRTGSPLGVVALIGVALIAGGLALRRAWPLPD
jgi:LPXTG-motif cell wall-anchored protein